MTPPEDIRASDADRQRVADALSGYAGEGRLSLDELSERLGETYAAKTIGQLAAGDGPLRELPPLSPPLSAPPAPSVWQDPTRLASSDPALWSGTPMVRRGPTAPWVLIAVLVMLGLGAGLGVATGGIGVFWLLFIAFFCVRKAGCRGYSNRGYSNRRGRSTRW